MLIGYVSDERDVALADVLVEIERGAESIAVARSTPRGAIHADVAPGSCRITLVRDGFGSKSVDVEVSPDRPVRLRLLADGLLGYMWPKWVKGGERAEFRVHSVEPYHLSLWRYGWKREMVKALGWHDEHGPCATMQITPDGDYAQGGARWNQRGYGSPHHTQLATAPDRSGLYYLHARTESGAFFSFPWVVAPASPSARIAVVASTNTWNAYNNFGGRSNYINASGLPAGPPANARLDLLRYSGGAYGEWRFDDARYPPLSFERPEPVNHIPEHVEVTDPIAGRSACHLAPAEWRLLGWLEREGFAHDLYADQHLHSGELDLDSYRVLILGPHPEYWSREMYERVKAWVLHRGGRLMYLGGNGINCAVEMIGGDAMRCRTQLLSEGGSLGMVDPADPSKRFESRFHRAVECEAALLGVVTTDAGIMTAAPYRVADASHWAFRWAGLREGDVFGERSLHERCPGGASGHETDKRCALTPPGTVLLAKGLNPEDGGAEMVCRELAGGGAVFSTGSITYAASLLVDDFVSRITATVVRRFLDEETPAPHAGP